MAGLHLISDSTPLVCPAVAGPPPAPPHRCPECWPHSPKFCFIPSAAARAGTESHCGSGTATAHRPPRGARGLGRSAAAAVGAPTRGTRHASSTRPRRVGAPVACPLGGYAAGAQPPTTARSLAASSLLGTRWDARRRDGATRPRATAAAAQTTSRPRGRSKHHRARARAHALTSSSCLPSRPSCPSRPSPHPQQRCPAQCSG